MADTVPTLQLAGRNRRRRSCVRRKIRTLTVQRVVVTADLRTARYPGERKDDIGGRFPGSRLWRLRRAFPKLELQWPWARSLAVHSCGDSHSFELCSLLTQTRAPPACTLRAPCPIFKVWLSAGSTGSRRVSRPASKLASCRGFSRLAAVRRLAIVPPSIVGAPCPAQKRLATSASYLRDRTLESRLKSEFEGVH